MELKNKTKFLLVLGIIFVAFLLFNTNTANAAESDVTTSIEDEISKYKCSIEIKDGSYILYNNYFDTKDVTVNANQAYNNIDITKKNIKQELYNDILESVNYILLIEVPSDTISVKESFSEKELEIIDLNNKKYVTIVYIGKCSNAGGSDTEESVEMYSGGFYKLEIIGNETTETKEFSLDLHLYSENFFECEVRIVNEKGVQCCSMESWNRNGDPEGWAAAGVPASLDFSKAYVEYFANLYMGESIEIDCLGTVPYVGKYGDRYKYRANLANVKVDYDIGAHGSIGLSDFSYKGSKDMSGFLLSEDYTIDNEAYIEKEETNTDTKLKFDLNGKFTGTVKAEEIEKSDLIYNKVEEKLSEYTGDGSDIVSLFISNIYIENGSFEDSLKLTFNVGEQYNGKNYFVTHMKNEKYEFEYFEGIVENGKIEIVVDSLSPFGIAIAEAKQEEPTDKGEKDDTPKTGTTDIIGYVLATTVLAGIGIVALKKKLK